MADIVIVDCSAKTTTSRPLTPQEQTVRAADATIGEQAAQVEATRFTSRQILIDRATAALQTNRDFTALANPTAQALAQVQALTRQNTALIRILLGLLDATD